MNGTGTREGGSRSVTTTEVYDNVQPVLVLRSVGDGEQEKKKKKSKSKVKWKDDVVDNEFMNKKKTKICCIFHPQREFGESSSESSDSSSDSGGSSESEDEGKSSSAAGKKKSHSCDHDHTHDHDDKPSRDYEHSSPNAYEKQPQFSKKSVPSRQS